MGDILQYTVTSEYHGIKAGRYLRTVCNLSARTLALLKRTEGSLTVDGKLLRTIDVLKEGSVIQIKLPSESNSIIPIEGSLDILYEDSYLLIVNKPADMPVHPVKSHQTDTLANIIAYNYGCKESEFVFRAVNRLDRDTSGIVIVAKDRHTASLMQKTEVTKHYLAVCHGVVPSKGTIDAPIGLCENSKIVRCVRSDGQCAITHYSGIASFSDATIVDLMLETGRTHQIRCHMSHIGNPLFGDDLYGGSIDLIKRQALHCNSVSFVHPFTGVNVDVHCKIPADICSLIQKLKEQHSYK